MSLQLRVLAPVALLCCFIDPSSAESDSERIVQLITALDDENVRIGASIALAKMGKDAVPALRESMTSDKPERQVWAAYTLGEIGPAAESAVDELTRALGSTDSAVRASAAQALGKIGTASVPGVAALASLLNDENIEVRRRSAVALGQIGPAAAQVAPRLITVLKDSRIRQAAKLALIQIGKPATSALRESLDDDELRFDISEILSKVDSESARQAGIHQPTSADIVSLRQVLHDPSRPPQERTTAATSLASIGQEGLDVLIVAFEDQTIASTAAIAFGHVGQEGVRPLIKSLDHELSGVRAAAADALGHIGPAASKALPNLVGLLKDPDHNVRYRAVLALDAFGPKAAPAVADLIEVMLDSSQREPARQWAIMTLATLAPSSHDKVVKALIKASQDKGNYGVSSLARQQVRKIDLEAAEAAGVR